MLALPKAEEAKMFKRWWLMSMFGLAFMVLGGCSWPPFAAAAPPPTMTIPPPTAAKAPLETPTPLPTTTPVPALMPSPTTSPATSLRPCVPQHPERKTLNMDKDQLLHGGLLQVLNAGMPLPNLDRALQRAGLGGYPQAALSVDMNGDHFEDAVVALLLSPQTQPPQGALLIYLCNKGQYAPPVVFQEPADRYAWGMPIVHFAQDMNADGRTELVVSAVHCDTNCAEKFAILGWRDGGLRDLLEDAAQPFPSPVPFLADPNGDGILDFIIETSSGERLVWHYQNGVWKR